MSECSNPRFCGADPRSARDALAPPRGAEPGGSAQAWAPAPPRSISAYLTLKTHDALGTAFLSLLAQRAVLPRTGEIRVVERIAFVDHATPALVKQLTLLESGSAWARRRFVVPQNRRALISDSVTGAPSLEAAIHV